MHLSVVGLVGLIYVIILSRIKCLPSRPTPQTCFPPPTRVYSSSFSITRTDDRFPSFSGNPFAAFRSIFILPSSLVSILTLWALCSYTDSIQTLDNMKLFFAIALTAIFYVDGAAAAPQRGRSPTPGCSTIANFGTLPDCTQCRTGYGFIANNPLCSTDSQCCQGSCCPLI